RATRDALDPERTLFIVASKSGDTLEALSFFAYFWEQVRRVKGDRTGESFVAITDPAAPGEAPNHLETLAQKHNFRRIWFNPRDVGGRYSALSYFGLVPAALMGIDVAGLLDYAHRMEQSCVGCVPAEANPGASLGAVMGTLARQGRDKVSLIASPGI